MHNEEVWQQIDAELANAETSRAGGLEGRARVCARRAAGIAIQEYFQQRQLETSKKNSYELIEALTLMPDIPEDLRQMAALLCKRVNEDYDLPVQADLIVEARKLARSLLNQDV